MRRIYESGALRRDDDDPFSPSEGDEREAPRALRSVPGATLSRLLVPSRLRDRAISIDVSTPRTEFVAGATVPFRVTLRNAMPFPVTIRTTSPLLWTWSIDGVTEASHVRRWDPPAEPRRFTFGRGERLRFERRWDGLFRVSDSEWEPAEPGEYTIGARLDVENAAERGLADEATVRLVAERE